MLQGSDLLGTLFLQHAVMKNVLDHQLQRPTTHLMLLTLEAEAGMILQHRLRTVSFACKSSQTRGQVFATSTGNRLQQAVTTRVIIPLL